MKTFFQSSSSKCKAVLSTVMLMTCALVANSQVAGNYIFSQTTGTYVPVTGTLVAAATDPNPGATPESAPMDDFTFTGIAIPFTFYFNGVAYTTLEANTNGWISFGGATTSTSSPISTSIGSGVIAAFATDMMGVTLTSGIVTLASNVITSVANTSFAKIGAPVRSGTNFPAGTTITGFTANTITVSNNATGGGTAAATISWASAEIRTDVQGVAPNRTFIVQFSDFAEYSSSGTGTIGNTNVNFQIRLNEGGGVATSQSIEIVYGNVYRPAGTETVQVGLRGATTSDYNNRMSTTSWTATTPGTSNTSNVAWNATVFPPSGLTFTWTPTSCLAPATPGTSNIGTTSADLTWTSPASTTMWEIEYGQSTFALGAGTRFVVTSNPYTLSTLSPATSYSYFVRAICGVGDTSGWSPRYSFVTNCVTVAAPFVESFNLATLPACWTNTGTELWQFATNGAGGPDYGAENATDHTGNSGYFAWADDSSPNNVGITLTSPVIDISTLATPRLRFYFWSYDNQTTPQNGSLVVKANTGSGWVTIDSIYQNFTAQWNERSISLAGLGSGPVQFQFIVNENIANNFYNDILLDDLYVENTPTCLPPSAPTVSNLQGTQAVVQWNQSTTSPANGYEWRVVAAGSGVNGTLVSAGSEVAGDTVANVTGLVSGTAYTFYVRAVCSTTDTSTWVNVNLTPACSNPTSLTSSNITTNSATFNWTASTSVPAVYQWVLTPAGSNVNTVVQSGVVTGTTLILTGLDSSTFYTLYLRSVCSPGDTTATYLSSTFETGCVVITPSYSQNFDYFSTHGPACWQEADGALTSASVLTGTSSSWAADGWLNSGTTGAAKNQFSAAVDNEWLITPSIDLGTSNTYILEFDVAFVGTSTATPAALGGDDTLALVISTDNGVTWNIANTLQLFTAANSLLPGGVQHVSIPLSSYSGVVKFGFYASEGIVDDFTTTGTEGMIDNFLISSTPLAVHLADIKASNIGSRNRVEWTTVSQDEGDYFVLERSADGREFNTVATISAKAAAFNYTYTDETPVPGVNYYRLKMFDAAGKFTTSKVVTATVSGNAAFKIEVYPNPVANVVNVKRMGVLGSDARILVTDISGKVISSLSATEHQTSIDMSNLSPGIYIIKYTDSNNQSAVKVNKL